MTPEELDAEIAQATKRVEQRRAELEAAAAVFRSTPDGMAEAMREAEHAAAVHGVKSPAVRLMHRQIIRAERDSADEYQDRTSRWGHRRGDGPLYALLLGNTAWADLADAAELVGTYRVPPAHHREPSVVVALYNTRTRKRARLSHPRPGAGRLTLDDVLEHAANEPPLFERVSRVLGCSFPPAGKSVTGQVENPLP